MEEALVNFLAEDIGINVIYIDESWYQFSKFVPADRDTHKHYLVGKNITKLITDNSMLQNIQTKRNDRVTLFNTQLDKIKRTKLEFHKNYMWKAWVIR